MPPLRYQAPDRLVGATAFSKHPELCGSLEIVNLLKEHPFACDELRQTCNLEENHGRKREPGQWELAAVAFVVSGHVDIQPWLANTTDELWEACGFPQGRPPYSRVSERLHELEKVSGAFLDATALVIQRCREHDPRVFAHAHFDSTEDETHAALVHDCQPGEPCKRKAKGSRKRNAAVRPLRAATSEAREQREAWNEQAPEDSVKGAREAEPEAEKSAGKRKRVLVGGCWYRTRDTEAGIRAYVSNGKLKRFWHGYSSGKIVDHYTGGVIPYIDSASTQESAMFPKMFDRVSEMAGAAPQTVIGDRGFSVASCFEHATRHGSAPVFPWRAANQHDRRQDRLTHDRHGVKRCKHCGGEMKQTRFAIDKADPNDVYKGRPCFWFKCVLPFTEACKGEQRMYCEDEWRDLIPLSRLEPLYHELKASHQEYEGAHDYWRDRYKVAADTLANRPKAVGLGWHRLRAHVACLVEWLRIAAKNKWLAPAPEVKRGRRAKQATTAKLKIVRRHVDTAQNALATLRNSRIKHELDIPYGPQAEALGLGEHDPPSERPGAPPGTAAIATA